MKIKKKEGVPMALVEIGKNHKEDIAKLRKRLAKLEKNSGSGATLKLKVEGENDDNYNLKLEALKKRLGELEKKSAKKKAVKKTGKKTSKRTAKAKKPAKDDMQKHREDIRKIKEKLSRLEKKKRNATIRPTLNFKTSIGRLNKNIETILEMLTQAGDEAGSGHESQVIEKLDLLLKQNEKIAQGILTVADMIKDKIDKEKAGVEEQPTVQDVSDAFSGHLDTVPEPAPTHLDIREPSPQHLNINMQNNLQNNIQNPDPFMAPPVQDQKEPDGSGLFDPQPVAPSIPPRPEGGSSLSGQRFPDIEFNRYAQPAEESIEPIEPTDLSSGLGQAVDSMTSFNSPPGQDSGQGSNQDFPPPPQFGQEQPQPSQNMDPSGSPPDFGADMFPPPPRSDSQGNMPNSPGGFPGQPPDMPGRPMQGPVRDFRPIQPNTAPIPPSGDKQRLKLRPFDNDSQ